MRFYTYPGARRANLSRGQRSRRRPLLERLEDRVVPSLADGTILVATAPSPFASDDQSSFPTGIIGLDPSTGAQSVVSTGGLFVLPLHIAETNQLLYVTDLTAFGTGAIIQVDPNTGQQNLVATGGFLNGPNALAFVNGYLYVADEGDSSGTIHNIVRIDPNSGQQTLITDGSGGGFTVPTGMVPAAGNNVYVVDEPGNFQGPDPGSVWEVNLDTGQQTLISHGGLIDHPVDVVVDPSGNIIIANTGSPENDVAGSVIQINPQTGVQTLITSFGPYSGIDSVEMGQDGTIFVGAIAGGSNPGQIYAVNPGSGAQSTLSSGSNLSLVGGIRIFHATVQTAATTTSVTSSANPSVFGQSVTFTATVTASAPGGGTPTGTVQFLIDGMNFGSRVNLSGGVATSTATSSLWVSGHTVLAVYSGDTNFTTSTGTLSQAVNQASTTATLSSSANPSSSGQSVIFTATISITAPGAGTPTGTVQFQIDGANAGSPVSLSSAGTASFSIASLAVGTHSVTAIYSGDSSFAASTGTLAGGQTVNNSAMSENGNVIATLNPFTGVLSIIGYFDNYAITIQQSSPGVLQVSGIGTLVNQSPNPASFMLSAITEIDVSLLSGNNSVTLNNFSIAGKLSIFAGSGSDTISLSTIAANSIDISAAGTSQDIVSVSGVTAASDLDITVGDNAQSVTVNGTSSRNLNIRQTGTTGSPSFDLENDTINNDLNLSAGDGSNTLVLSHVKVTSELLMAFGAGKNTVTADDVTALFGSIDGGPSGNNNYFDGGGNSGFLVIHFLGH